MIEGCGRERTLMRMRASTLLKASAAVAGGLLLSAVAASPTWAAAPSQMSNQFSQYDMADIEYFNEVNFMGDVSLTVQQPTATTYGVLLVCPPTESPSFPPPTLDISLATSGGQATTSCPNPKPLEISRDSADCMPTGACALLFKASNKMTGLTYSTTMTDFLLNRPMTLIPHLNPATLPINGHSTLLPPTDTTSSGLGTLQLCEASKACDSGDTPASGYSWNSSVYFQTMIRDKIPNQG